MIFLVGWWDWVHGRGMPHWRDPKFICSMAQRPLRDMFHLMEAVPDRWQLHPVGLEGLSVQVLLFNYPPVTWACWNTSIQFDGFPMELPHNLLGTSQLAMFDYWRVHEGTAEGHPRVSNGG